MLSEISPINSGILKFRKMITEYLTFKKENNEFDVIWYMRCPCTQKNLTSLNFVFL